MSATVRHCRRPFALLIALGAVWLVGPGTGSAFAAAPVCNNNSYSVDNTQTLALPITENCSDDDGDSMQGVLNTNVSHGSLQPDGAGGAVYHPTAGYVGPDGFTFHAVSGSPQESSNVATISINVTGTPGAGTPPNCSGPGFVQAYQAQTSTFSPFCFDADTPSNQLTASVVTDAAHGDVTFTGLNGSYAADDYSGPDSFSFKVSDGTNESAVVPVTVDVRAVPAGNLAPTCPASHAFVEKNDPVGVLLKGNCVDPDNDLPITYSLAAPSIQHGTLCCFTSDSVIYKPAADFVGEDVLGYSAQDPFHPPVVFHVDISVLEDIDVCCETAPEATPDDPYAASVDSPVAGPIYIDTRAQTGLFPAPIGYTFAGQEYDITTPDAEDPDDPLKFVFKLDGTELAALDLDPDDVIIFRNGAPIDDPCPPVEARDDDPEPWWPCEDDRDVIGGDLWVTVLTMKSSVYNIGTTDVQDADGDGIADEDDNCVNASNPTQADVDQDDVGTACDTKEKPTTKDECKKNGWRDFNGIYTFRNEGDCVSHIATGGKNKPHGKRRHGHR